LNITSNSNNKYYFLPVLNKNVQMRKIHNQSHKTYFVETDFAHSGQVTKLKLQRAGFSCAYVTKVSSSILQIEMTARQSAPPDIKTGFEHCAKFHLSRQQTRCVTTNSKTHWTNHHLTALMFGNSFTITANCIKSSSSSTKNCYHLQPLVLEVLCMSFPLNKFQDC